MSIVIDGISVEVTPGETVLAAAKRAGIDIPSLCALPCASTPAGACRLCLVEVEGEGRLQTSCTLPVRDGLVVRAHTPRLLTIRRNIVELMLSNAKHDCAVCPRQGECDLARLARVLGVHERRFSGIERSWPIDISSPAVTRDPNKCVLCGRCVTVCQQVQGVGAIDFAGRGFTTRVAPAFHASLNVSSCVFCGQCVRVCPTGALMEKSHVDGVLEALADPRCLVVAQVAPAVPATLLEDSPGEPVTTTLERICAALHRVGFEAVFDTTFAADLTVVEEATELVDRIRHGGPLPMFTSCSPAWIHYVETQHPHLIPHLSTCKSPQQMAATLIKQVLPSHLDTKGRRIVCVSVMPCTAKKYEAFEQGDVDFVLTTRELVKLLARFGIDPARCSERLPLDPPFSESTGAGRLFGGTGGVMEAAVRTVHKLLTDRDLREGWKVPAARGMGPIRHFDMSIAGQDLSFAVVNGIGHVQALLEDIESKRLSVHFVEVMSCPGGCVAGGGQPYDTDLDAVRRRIARLQEADRRARQRASHASDSIETLYQKVLGTPGGQASHHMLHRHYVDRTLPEGAAER